MKPSARTLYDFVFFYSDILAVLRSMHDDVAVIISSNIFFLNVFDCLWVSSRLDFVILFIVLQLCKLILLIEKKKKHIGGVFTRKELNCEYE